MLHHGSRRLFLFPFDGDLADSDEATAGHGDCDGLFVLVDEVGEAHVLLIGFAVCGLWGLCGVEDTPVFELGFCGFL